METQEKVDLPPGRDPVLQRLGGLINRLTRREERMIDRTAFLYPWSEDMCLALKTEIEEKPEGIDTDGIIEETHSRLANLLGPPRGKKISLKNRIIFTDPATLRAFLYFYEQPSGDPDKYWKAPIEKIVKTRRPSEAQEMCLGRAVAFPQAGLIIFPNGKIERDQNDPEEVAYLDENGVSEEEYPELDMRQIIAHEIVHLLYPSELSSHPLLVEPIVDYVVLEIFPELRKLAVKFEWAKAAVEDYMKCISCSSIKDLLRPRVPRRSSIAAGEIVRKYFSIPYRYMGLPESYLTKWGLSKYDPIPE